MPDFSKGQIYKLTCLDPNIKEIYVGSTTNFKQRKKAHKRDSKKLNQLKYKFIRDNGGWSNWDMIWIKDFPCNKVQELKAEENKIMKELKAMLNSYNAIGVDIKKKKETIKKWIKNNPDKIKASRNKLENKIKKKKCNKEWDLKNKERNKIKKKEYYEKNKEYFKKQSKINHNKINDIKKKEIQLKRGQKITCPCGSLIRLDSKSRHEKTKKHQTFLKSSD